MSSRRLHPAWAAIGALGVGLACNACCWLPALLVATGGAAVAGLGHWLEPWRPVLLGIAATQLFFGFRAAYRPVGACCSVPHDHRGVSPALLRRINIGVMWAVAGLVIGLNAPAMLNQGTTHTGHDHEHIHAQSDSPCCPVPVTPTPKS